MNFIVLSSSRGTTFQSVINRLKDESLTAECLGLITDRPDRGCIEKAKAAGLPYRVVERRKKDDRQEHEIKLNTAINDLQISRRSEIGDRRSKTGNRTPDSGLRTPILACMGWMWILSPAFIREHKGLILNVHPALLPKYGGEGMYGHHVHDAVLKAGDKESGMTIHLMDEEVDTGRILLQKTCPVMADDTAETLQQRVQELEKEWYPKCLQMIHLGEISSL